MKELTLIRTAVVASGLFVLSSCSMQEEKTAAPAPATPPAKAEAKPAPAEKAPATTAEKAPAKAKVTKASGDIGLVDMEKNYLILVTKAGKLVTLDFDAKTKAFEITPTPAKIADIGLGSSATVTYQSVKDKNVATSVEFKPAKGE